MPMTLVIKAAAYKGGPVLTRTVANFPINMAEAVARFGEDSVYADFVRNYTIKVQGKMRADYSAPNTTGSTKKGSAISQILAARVEARRAEANAAYEAELAAEVEAAANVPADETPNEESPEINEE